jgi:splicing factor 45
MSKYGWTSGTGLGASSSGIINPLHVKVEKRKKRADADGGGWADPANKGKILGGQRAAPVAGDEARSTERGKMSEVIVLENMLENMPDLQEEISAGLGQEIGEECGEKVSFSSHPQSPPIWVSWRLITFDNHYSMAASRDST